LDFDSLSGDDNESFFVVGLQQKIFLCMK